MYEQNKTTNQSGSEIGNETGTFSEGNSSFTESSDRFKDVQKITSQTKAPRKNKALLKKTFGENKLDILRGELQENKMKTDFK